MRLGTLSLFAAAVAALFAFGSAPGASRSVDTLGPGPGFAVVELFTSQGCSSCPPADRVLARLAEVAEAKGLPVYPLSMHVDYWNRLGWKDPFSQARFSARQQSYAEVLGKGAFTPQVIVNGVVETVGSREAELAERIARQLEAVPEARVTLELAREGARLRVRPTVENAPPGGTLWLALTRRSSANHVPLGENAGRDLRHAHVVLVLEKVPLGQSATFELPPALQKDHGFVTAFVQDPVTMQIVAATRAEAG